MNKGIPNDVIKYREEFEREIEEDFDDFCSTHQVYIEDILYFLDERITEIKGVKVDIYLYPYNKYDQSFSHNILDAHYYDALLFLNGQYRITLTRKITIINSSSVDHNPMGKNIEYYIRFYINEILDEVEFYLFENCDGYEVPVNFDVEYYRDERKKGIVDYGVRRHSIEDLIVYRNILRNLVDKNVSKLVEDLIND